MNVDEFTDEALKLSGLRGVKQRDAYLRKIDTLEERITENLTRADLGGTSLLQNLHLWLWASNQSRFPQTYSDANVSEYSSISHIIDKELYQSKEPIGICAGLVAEYIILSERFAIPVEPIHLQGISDSHVYLRSFELGLPIFINPVHHSGYRCNVETEALKRSKIISHDELLGLLFNNVAVTHSYYHNYTRALQKIQNALRYYSSAPEILFNKAHVQLKQGAIHKAESALHKLPEFYHRDSRVLFLEGELEFAKGNYKGAARIFYDVALHKDNQHSSALRNVGMSLNRMGHTGEAIQFLKTALDLNPNDGKARREFYTAMRKP